MVRWDKRLINKASDVPSCKLQNSLQKLFQFISLFLYKFTKTRIKSFECPKSIKNCEKNNAQNIRRLVCESFDPATQQFKPAYYIEDCWILLCNEFVTLKVPFIECSSDLGTTLVKPSSSFITFVFQFQNISIIIYQIFTQ